MKIVLREQIESVRKQTNLNWDIIEQDYLLSWVLYGISKVPRLNESLIFKGGTALKKCYFGDYRFSQDLDFSILGKPPSSEDIFALVKQATQVAIQGLEALGNNIDIHCKPYQEKQPHPEGQVAFVFSAKFPWHRDFHTSVMAEITFKESVLLSPVQRPIIHNYSEELNTSINVYPLEEIVAEKIRAILQFYKKVFERGWGRSRVRDYYDLWRILSQYSDTLDKSIIPVLVREKCAAKNIVFEGVEELFAPKLMSIITQDWKRWLHMTVPVLPEKDLVITELHKQLNNIFLNSQQCEGK